MKTKPFGVRFEEDLLKELGKTPQQALNFLTQFYRDNKPNECDFPKIVGLVIDCKGPFLKDAEACKLPEPSKKTLSKGKWKEAARAKPPRKKGESGIDYAIRVNEWMTLQKNKY